MLAFSSAPTDDDARPRGQSGAVVAVQRTSSDLKLNPHVHAVFLDGGYREEADGEIAFDGLAHLETR